MDPEAMEPFALALNDYFRGDASAPLILRRDDGVEDTIPLSLFFRSLNEFTPIELVAIEHCQGHVLDIGAGTGIHSLVLQSKALSVTAVDISSSLVELMAQRGVLDVRCSDIFTFVEGPFDTLLMLGHGIGMVEDIPGLARFLDHAHTLVRGGGQILIHSLDVGMTDDPIHLSYHETRRRAGKYIGEIRLQIEYLGKTGPYCGWLHVDPQTLYRMAGQANWECEVIHQQNDGDYLARLFPLRAL